MLLGGAKGISHQLFKNAQLEFVEVYCLKMEAGGRVPRKLLLRLATPFRFWLPQLSIQSRGVLTTGQDR